MANKFVKRPAPSLEGNFRRYIDQEFQAVERSINSIIDEGTGSSSGGGGATTFSALTDTPSSFGTAGQVVQVNSTRTGLEYGTGSSGPSTFTGLSDTPINMGSSGQILQVNATNNGLEFRNAPPANLTDLGDTPSTLGTAGQVLQVNNAGNALVFGAGSGSGTTAPISDVKIYRASSVGISSSDWLAGYWNEVTPTGYTQDRTPSFVQSDPSNWTLITYMVPQALYGKFSGTSNGCRVILYSTTSTATTSSNRSSITNLEYSVYYGHQSNASGSDFNHDSIHVQVLRQIPTLTYFDVYGELQSGGFMHLSNATHGSHANRAEDNGFFMFQEVTI